MAKKKNQAQKQRLIVRFIAIVLAILLAGSVLVSAIFSSAYGEEAIRDQYEMHIEYMEDEQALRISQRLVYHNRTGRALDRVIFTAAANTFRRESALNYENDALGSVFPYGFAPAGIELESVSVNGVAADWGWQGKNETALRIACALEAGGKCEFEMQYYVLLGSNCAFLGQGDLDVRLSGFYFIPGIYLSDYEEFLTSAPLSYAQWLQSDAADYSVTLAIPDAYLPAGTGDQALVQTENHTSIWQFTATNAREFAVCFGKRYREYAGETDSGMRVRVLGNDRSASKKALSEAIQTIEVYESLLGAFPIREIELAESNNPLDALNFPGLILLPSNQMSDSEAIAGMIRFSLAKQYIGFAAYPMPVDDAWLSDSICSYLALLAIEETRGYDAFVKALNDQVLDALKITIPGGLYVTASADLFESDTYRLIVRDRGAVVMHEMRVAMGRENLIAALRTFYEKGLRQNVLGEYDLVDAMNEVTGGDWEEFLTDWLFNVDDYVDQQMDYYE